MGLRLVLAKCLGFLAGLIHEVVGLGPRGVEAALEVGADGNGARLRAEVHNRMEDQGTMEKLEE